jgi:hypothetical protein
MRADVILGAIMMAMAVLGGIVSAHAPDKIWQKAVYGASFLLLGIVGFYFAVKQSNETAVANKELSQSIKKLGESSKEITRIEGLNAALQNELLSQGKTIANLATRGIYTATGGDTFSYMDFLSYLPHKNSPLVVSKGEYPLYDLVARVVDLAVPVPKMEPSNDPSRILEASQLFQNYQRSAEVTLQIGNMSAGAAWFPNLDLPFNPEHGNFNVFFSARNGFWNELYRSVGPPGHRVVAILVQTPERKPASLRGSRHPARARILYQNIAEGFPRRKDGTPDLDMTLTSK